MAATRVPMRVPSSEALAAKAQEPHRSIMIKVAMHTVGCVESTGYLSIRHLGHRALMVTL